MKAEVGGQHSEDFFIQHAYFSVQLFHDPALRYDQNRRGCQYNPTPHTPFTPPAIRSIILGMKWTTLPAALTTFLLSVGPVLAQNAPKAPAMKSTAAQPWASIVVAVLMILLVMVPSFLSSKRGHQD